MEVFIICLQIWGVFAAVFTIVGALVIWECNIRVAKPRRMLISTVLWPITLVFALLYYVATVFIKNEFPWS
jgi:hypothetical protein